jgi:endonuclease YncB( thermonuclease family)
MGSQSVVHKLVALALAFSCSAWADTTAERREGLVVSVHDGDTLTVLVGKQQVKVRLAEIDAPELRQSFGNRSKQSLAELCFQESAKMELVAKDRYGRSVGKVKCRDVDASAHQVALGMAWVYDRYSKPGSPLYSLQDAAKAAKRGLWADNEPVRPWEWRRAREEN